MNFLSEYVFFIILAAMFILLLLDFSPKRKTAWWLLGGMGLLLGYGIFNMIRRRKLLDQFKEREAALKEQADRYDDLMAKNKISQTEYEAAKSELARAKTEYAIEIQRIRDTYEKRLKDIDEKYDNISDKELAKEIREILDN